MDGLKKKIQKLQTSYIRGVWDGTIDPLNLSEKYYELVGAYFTQAIEHGFDLTKIKFGDTDAELVEELKSNVYMFSAARTFQQTLEMSNAMTDDTGEIRTWKEFLSEAENIYTRYNGGDYDSEVREGWLETEYNTAISQSYNAKKWKDIEDKKTILPYLRFVAVGDELVCDICGELNGLTAPVDDDVWDEASPAQHFNCRCILEQLDVEEGSDAEWSEDEKDEALENANIPDEFKFNPGKNKEIFATEGIAQHPYFIVPKEYQRFAEQNFELPLPEMVPTMDEKVKELMEEAKKAAPEVEKVSTKIAEKHDAGLTPINFKEGESIARKALDDYNGDVSMVTDAVRNTIIADERSIPGIIRDFRNELSDVRVKQRISSTDPLGYSGNVINYKTKTGLTVETQVNTARMIYAKEKHAKEIIGDELFESIKKSTGMESGLGHKYYEEWRVITEKMIEKDPSLIETKQNIERLSKKYYSNFY